MDKRSSKTARSVATNALSQKIAGSAHSSARSGRFSDNLTGPKGITKEAFDALASLKFTRRERESIFNTPDDPHEKLTGSAQQ